MPRSPARASSICSSPTRGSAKGCAPCSRRVTRSAPRKRSLAGATSSRWSRRHRPARSPWRRRGTAPTATRSRACWSSRATTSSGSTTTTTRAPRWSSFRASVEAVRARGGAAGGRLPGRLHRRHRARARRSGRRHAQADRGLARGLPHRLRHVGEPERDGAARRGSLAEDRHVRGRWDRGRERRPTATTRTAHSSARPTAPFSLRRRQSRTCGTSSSAASTRRSTSSAPTTTATSDASRLRPRCSGTTRSGSRCSSTSSSTSCRAASDEDVEAARRRRLPR